MDKKKIVEIFSANVRAERARKNYTQEKVAEFAEISTEYLSKIENGKACPTTLVLANLALALGVTLDTLLPLDNLKNN